MMILEPQQNDLTSLVCLMARQRKMSKQFLSPKQNMTNLKYIKLCNKEYMDLDGDDLSMVQSCFLEKKT